jgi:drug/metabolite transporter (DMT)-like permease
MQSLWMLFASFMFAIMGVCVKLASSMYSISEIIMYRGLVGVIVLFCIIRFQGGNFRTTMPREHLWRGVIGVIALWLWFYAIAALPLATAVTLNYMAPIWITVMLFFVGWLRNKSSLERPLVAAIVLSFIGVVLLLQPVFAAQQLGAAIVALVSGMLSALAYLQVRRLGLMGEPEYRVVFYFSVINVAAGVLSHVFVAGPLAWSAHESGYGAALLLVTGLSATMAQMAMTRAYRLGNTLVVANMQYAGIVFSSIWGIVIFGDVFAWTSWLGIALIVASGIAATYYNHRKTQLEKQHNDRFGGQRSMPLGNHFKYKMSKLSTRARAANDPS